MPVAGRSGVAPRWGSRSKWPRDYKLCASTELREFLRVLPRHRSLFDRCDHLAQALVDLLAELRFFGDFALEVIVAQARTQIFDITLHGASKHPKKTLDQAFAIIRVESGPVKRHQFVDRGLQP